MLSVIQYKRTSLAVRKQVERDHEKAGPQLSAVPQVLGMPENAPRRGSASSGGSSLADHDPVLLDRIGTATTVRTQHSLRTALGHALQGIHARDRMTHEGKGELVFVVGWDGENDPMNPRNWNLGYRAAITLCVAFLAFVVGAASSTDTAILPQAAAEFGVGDVVESMAIGLYLAGFGVGSIFAGPFSEAFGRNAIYISTMIIYMIFVMASALAPNIGAQLTFRFLAGAFGATPLTCAGGSISDIWSPLEKTFAFPLYAIPAFGGPVLGPVIGSYIINLGSWRWAEWIVLLISALSLILIVLFQPETYHPLLLKWKAEHLRKLTGDDRFRAEMEIVDISLWGRLRIALERAAVLSIEPIVLFMTLYLTVLYIVLFTFLDGYSHIFEKVYGVSQGLSNIIFTGLFVGILMGAVITPWIFKITKRSFANNTFVPEIRLWFAMLGAPAVPISLYWMAWTDFKSISIWSPILASVLLGYGIICIFMTAYMYIIDSYEIYAASALVFLTFTRYLVAGGMTVVGVPFYNNLGPHWTLTILGSINLLMTPIPYIFYKYGHVLRKRSKKAVSWN